MGSRSRRRRSLLGTRGDRVREGTGTSGEPEDALDEATDLEPEDALDEATDLEPEDALDDGTDLEPEDDALDDPLDLEPEDAPAPGLGADGPLVPDLFGEDEVETERADPEALEPDGATGSDAGDPDAGTVPPALQSDTGPETDETWSPPPHWPPVRFASRTQMLKGFVREPEEPLLEEWELKAFVGLGLLAIGATLLGGGTILGLWLVLGSQLWQAWNG